jgi:hypothetical protein
LLEQENIMPFTGKATYSAGPELPEIAEDVSDLVGIVSADETPLLDLLGDPVRPARSTVHEWLEDALLPNVDTINDGSIGSPLTETSFDVSHVGRFRAGDLLRVEGSGEVMLVTGLDVDNSRLTVTRGYGGTSAEELVDGATIHILGNGALEGADADAARFTTRTRRANYTQIFSSTVEVSASESAVQQLAVRDELDYQKSLRMRELLRDLENCVINGVSPQSDPQGSAGVRRTMRGIISFLSTNQFSPGEDGFPSGSSLTEDHLNTALRRIWTVSGGVDLIVVGGREKRAINNFIASQRRFYSEQEKLKNMVSVYESDFGVCRIVLSRYVPTGTVLLLDSSRIEVLPLASRSFHYKPLARTGDAERGQVVGEYTLELRNENAHGIIRGFTA